MTKIVFDSYALIAVFREEPGHEAVLAQLLKIANGESEGYITAINVGEIFYMVSRKSNTKSADAAIAALQQMPIQVVEPDLKLCLQAAAIKAKHALSYADAFAAALTINKRGLLITGDREFESLKNEAGFKVKYL